jgi:ureidoacrylate peracid hydrolase
MINDMEHNTLKNIFKSEIIIILFFLIILMAGTMKLNSDENKSSSKHWERPENIFTLNNKTAAFVVIDMQNFSCRPASRSPLAQIAEVIDNINKLADICRKKNIPVIWVRHNLNFDSSGNNAGLYPLFHDPSHTKPTMNYGQGTEIYSQMNYDPSNDKVVFKNRYSAFLSKPPELKNILDSLDRKQLIIAGIAANVCVESTVRDAMQLDYEVILVKDAVSSTEESLQKCSLTNIHNFFGDVRTADNIIVELSNDN